MPTRETSHARAEQSAPPELQPGSDSTGVIRQPLRATRRRTRLALLCCSALLLATGPVAALPLLTEIYYNGPAPGSDPDEYVELTNPAAAALPLGGFRFDQGISHVFAPGYLLPGFASLVLARDEAGFRAAFPAYVGALLEFSGGLSNSGETLRLLDAAGTPRWTLAYDDGGSWPGSADGGGDALQLIPGGDPALASGWRAGAPDPGSWAGVVPPPPPPVTPTAVPAPVTALLLAAGAWALRRTRRGDHSSVEIPRRSRLTVAAS